MVAQKTRDLLLAGLYMTILLALATAGILILNQISNLAYHIVIILVLTLIAYIPLRKMVNLLDKHSS